MESSAARLLAPVAFINPRILLCTATSHSRRRPLALRAAAGHISPLPPPSKPPTTHTSRLHHSLSLSHALSRFLSSPPFDTGESPPPSGETPRQAIDEPDQGIYSNDRNPSMVVLLGWLGAEIKHLKRYAALYTSRGFRAVRFVVPVKDFFGLDLGTRIEQRIARLAGEIVNWCQEMEREGKEPQLLVHTFSNAGWLSYGVMLENLQKQSSVIEKIKGCVIDSGPVTEIYDPKIWAGGFGAAMLKKGSSLTSSSDEPTGGGRGDSHVNGLNGKNFPVPLNEAIWFFMLEKFFGIVLLLPEVRRKLDRILVTLSNNQPSCPQLYLYSTADKLIPAGSIISFMQKQATLGVNVYSYDFVTSPHVDHYRSYPTVYAMKIHDFLEVCGLQ